MLAAKHGSRDCIQYALEQGVDANAKNSQVCRMGEWVVAEVTLWAGLYSRNACGEQRPSRLREAPSRS